MENNIYQWKKDVACFASHIQALKQFIASGEAEGLICEDDTLFHNNFVQKYTTMMQNLPYNTSLVSLTYMLGGAIDLLLCKSLSCIQRSNPN
jgi:GR25 family glycosyltransferase involved in LPS biosynthesis